MIIEYRYDYWGDNGRYHESKLEEYESEEFAITDLGFTAHHNAIEGCFEVIRVIAGEEGAQERITAGIEKFVARKEREDRIYKLKRSIAENERWFKQLDEEKDRRGTALYNQRSELIKLEKEQ